VHLHHRAHTCMHAGSLLAPSCSPLSRLPRAQAVLLALFDLAAAAAASSPGAAAVSTCRHTGVAATTASGDAAGGLFAEEGGAGAAARQAAVAAAQATISSWLAAGAAACGLPAAEQGQAQGGAAPAGAWPPALAQLFQARATGSAALERAATKRLKGLLRDFAERHSRRGYAGAGFSG
jgi:hypothetical protein